MIYFIGLLGMKICVFFIIQLVPFIVKVGDWALRWTEGNAAVQIFFVMLLFPVIMNAIQYYIIDTFIKKPMTRDDEMLAEEDDCEGTLVDGEHDHRSGLLAGLEDDGILETEDDTVQKDAENQFKPPSYAKDVLGAFKPTSFNPISHGGHSSSTSSSSSSSSSNSR